MRPEDMEPRHGYIILNHQVMRPLETDGIPEHLWPWQDDVCGPGAVVRAVRDALAGQTATLVACDRIEIDGKDAFSIRTYATIALGRIGGRTVLRYVGERLNPTGAGSSTVRGGLDESRLVAELCRWMPYSAIVFRAAKPF